MSGARTVLYVASAQRTGSTLLDLLLGNHPRVFGVGEVFKLHVRPGERVCSCGAAIPECPFWSAVGRRLAGGGAWDWSAFPLERIVRNPGRTVRRVPGGTEVALALGSRAGLRALAALPGPAREHLEGARNSWRLFDAVAEEAGVDVVVDSSKNAVRMKKLWLLDPGRLRVVHLVRDGRANLASMRRTTDRTVERIAREWVRQVRNVRAMLRTIPPASVRLVRYEDLCDDPRATLEDVFRWAGLEWSDRVLDLGGRRHHNIPGNPMLFRALRDIRKDERWRAELTPADLATFERVAGRFNRALGS